MRNQDSLENTNNSRSVFDPNQKRQSNLDMPKQMDSHSKLKAAKKKRLVKAETGQSQYSPRMSSDRVKRVPAHFASGLNRSEQSKLSSGYKSPCDSVRSTNSGKFGFSTLQYKKLQIIKTTRQLNMKVFMEIIRTMSNRFYTNVLKAYLVILKKLRTDLNFDE